MEESIRVEESIKSPDYSFRLGRKLKFFVETKKPSINIEGGIYPAFQLRRYAWSASLSLSILTDFEEFAVYDCRAEPKKIDKPGKGRLLYLQYDQYVERWDEIAALFSKEAVLAGSLKSFIDAVPKKRGIKRVDAVLLDEISQWREALAGNLARRNPSLSQSDLNFLGAEDHRPAAVPAHLRGPGHRGVRKAQGAAAGGRSLCPADGDLQGSRPALQLRHLPLPGGAGQG